MECQPAHGRGARALIPGVRTVAVLVVSLATCSLAQVTFERLWVWPWGSSYCYTVEQTRDRGYIIGCNA
ncbi:MAG: hypothetical protein R6X12_09415, partial [bacterium]